jgi:hypothetical protein
MGKKVTGTVDLKNIPIDAALHNIMDGDDRELRGRCGVLVAMYDAGKKESAIFLYGLMAQNYGNMARKEIIVKALGNIETEECANILFKELQDIESNNSTRGYIDTILKSISRLPHDIISEGIKSLLNDKKWSYKMKAKFEDILIRKTLAV